jgi:hypothetical protein
MFDKHSVKRNIKLKICSILKVLFYFPLISFIEMIFCIVYKYEIN